MKKNLSFAAIWFVCFSASAFASGAAPGAAPDFAPGFDSGNKYTSTYIEGEITVSCRNPSTGESAFSHFRCAANFLSPAAMARFIGPLNTGANKVSLKSTREDGSVKEKSESYDSAKGISTGRFNLLISTLLQRPLLKLGKNRVQYALSKDGKILQKGAFEAVVSQGEDRSCQRRGHYYSTDISDCRFSDRFCSQYFAEEDYCKR